MNGVFTKRIVGRDLQESNELLGLLYAQAALPEIQCRFRWQPCDVAFWDNRSTQHQARPTTIPSAA